MQYRINASIQNPKSKSTNAVSQVLLDAKKLHKLAKSPRLSHALPILRRLIAVKAVGETSLVSLSRNQSIIQRKHILRMLALEAGSSSWEQYRPMLEKLPTAAEQSLTITSSVASYPNLWFSSFKQAQDYCAIHGGEPIRVVNQAVVLVHSD